MIPIKTPQEILIMQEGGQRLANICALLLDNIKAGVTGLEIEKEACSLIKKANGIPSFTQVLGYQYATCLCVNDIVVHGVPQNYPFQDGDLVGLDIGMYFQNFHNDMSWTVPVGHVNSDSLRFLTAGKKALLKALEKMEIGNFVGHISKAIEEEIKYNGYTSVKALVGHGIGKNLHEDPQIPCFLRGKIENTAKIKEGYVFAIEVIYNEGSHKVIYKNDDGWSISTRDGKLSGLFELTVAAAEKGPLVLTTSTKFATISGI